MTDAPNLYGFATKELAQDATLAYDVIGYGPNTNPKYTAYRRQERKHDSRHRIVTERLTDDARQSGYQLCQEGKSRFAIESSVDRIDIMLSRSTPIRIPLEAVVLIFDKER